MTTKFIDLQTISIRPQNDNDKILLDNVSAMIKSGKKVNVEFDGKDMLLRIRSEK